MEPYMRETSMTDFIPKLTKKKICVDCGGETVGADRFLENLKTGKKDQVCRNCYRKRLGKEENGSPLEEDAQFHDHPEGVTEE